MMEVQKSLNSTKKPFESIPEVDVQSHSEMAMRYKFLVLCGGSCLGKTIRQKSGGRWQGP